MKLNRSKLESLTVYDNNILGLGPRYSLCPGKELQPALQPVSKPAGGRGG